MKFDKNQLLLYAVTDRSWLKENETLKDAVEKALRGGATCIQLREKNLSDEDFIAEAKEIKALCSRYRVPLIINDNLKAAIACKADGIHVGQDDLSVSEIKSIAKDSLFIGVSVHSKEQAKKAEKDGADYLGLGAAFATSTKEDVDVMPEKSMKAILENTDLPAVAIGGITLENMDELKGRGLNGAAVVSAIFASEDIQKAARQLKEKAGSVFCEA